MNDDALRMEAGSHEARNGGAGGEGGALRGSELAAGGGGSNAVPASSLVASTAALAVQLSAEQVRQVHDEIAAVVAAADRARETLRAIGGPDPGTFGNRLAFQINTGAGFFREAQAVIEIAWRARGKVAEGGEG